MVKWYQGYPTNPIDFSNFNNLPAEQPVTVIVTGCFLTMDQLKNQAVLSLSLFDDGSQ